VPTAHAAAATSQTTMTPREFCASGERETLKGSFHAAAATLLGVMALYNVAAWCFRRERHLAVNAVLYAAGAAFELKQTRRHFTKET
jgi:hypothetical protein